MTSEPVKNSQSSNDPKGLRIALERIECEAREKTGILNLGGLGLVEPPPELFELQHLRCLSLGRFEFCENEEMQYRDSDKCARNQILRGWDGLVTLTQLTKLSIYGVRCQDLSPVARLMSLKSLDCSSTQVSDLVPLSGLTGLRSLRCSYTSVSDLAPLSGLIGLRSLHCNRTQVSDLAPLSCLKSLQKLDCSRTQVSDLAPLSGLIGLQLLNCDVTHVSDLAPLSGLTSLQQLDCRRTPVGDLAPLSGLLGLQSLDCNRTQVSDLAPLSGLTSLQKLHCSYTQVSGLAPLSGLTSLQSLHCSSTQVPDLSPLTGLTCLQSLHCSYTQVSDLAPLSGLIGLQSLHCSRTQVSDLAPLSGLTSLQSLECWSTQVSDLSPLTGLTSLQLLDCAETQVSDLAPLSGLSSLQSLHCSRTQVSDLAPLSGLTSLQSLECWSTQVSDLSPLTGLTNLQLLDCAETQVRDLAPLFGLSCLRSLRCSYTQVSDLAPLSGLTGLRSLDCKDTQVSVLSSLSGLTNLQRLDCSSTQVSDLATLTGLTSLQQLYLDRSKVCQLHNVPVLAKRINANDLTLDALSLKIASRSALERFHAHKTTIPGIPQEVLSKESYDNCLPRLRAHLADIEQGTAQTHDVKLIVIGNGRVGKTQIARRLRGMEPEAEPESTHGIVICSFDLQSEEAKANSEPIARIHLWDFGGQDIYHGTHALFMRTNAVFLLVWSSSSEASSEHEYRGLTFKNHRVPYWLKHIGRLAGFEQPVLIVQNQCDLPRDEQTLSLPEGTLKSFRFVQQRHYSALNNRGRAGLDEALREAIADTIQRRGKILIGRGRAAVIAELDEMRRQDEVLPESQRRFRTLGMEAFRELCEKTGGISSVEFFLEYLHDCGLVFYRPGMFNDQIILDQAWALQAIYTVLDRSGPYTALRQLNGRFTRSLLALSAWKEYSTQEQPVFLSMMESCGICFKHRTEHRQLGIEAEYIAPELLPSRSAVAGQIASQWEHPGETVCLVCEYAYDDPSLIRSIIAEIGKRAKGSAIYWRFGACGYDLQSSSHFLLDYQADGTNSSRITLECRGPRSQLLANELRKLIESINMYHGVRDATWSGDALDRELLSHPKRLDASDAITHELELENAGPTEPTVQLKLGPSPSSKAKEHFVSYAWGDDTPEGIERTKAINVLCDKAKQTGIEIIRDVDHMQIGDRISQFMDRIGESQRVFVILSEKYLKSEFCMYELWSIWKNCKQNPEQFLSRIRVYKLPCVNISKTSDQLKCAAYWVNQKKEIDQLVQENGLSIIGETSLKKYKCMQDFAAQTSEILSHIADVLKPKDFEDLLERGFRE